jgi:hypothetical protein
VVKVTYQPTDFSVLVRAYGKGSELIIDRKQEIIVSSIYKEKKIFFFLSKHPLSSIEHHYTFIPKPMPTSLRPI